ncbi:MAG: hypothetical protein Q9222_006500 [Ikaeria aurantiellina]
MEKGTPSALSEEEKFNHRNDHGITLIPPPTEDPRDPLNWSLGKKLTTLFIVTLAGFVGLAQTVATNSGYFIQAKLYHKSAVQLSYGTSAGIVGLAVGPLVWAPLAQRIGSTSCIFWGMILTIICGSWSAVMTGPGDYNNFVVSRFFSGIFGSVATAVGAGTIVDIFFLHQRGKSFMFYLATLNLGTVIAPTVSGYIVNNVTWTVQIWWCVAVEGVVAVLAFLFMEETAWPRDGKPVEQGPRSWLQNRRDTFLPGHRILSGLDKRRSSPFTAIRIGLTPLSFLGGLLLTIDYGWLVAKNTLLAVFLQTPKKAGGYGFTPAQNASFNFSQWLGVIAAIVYGYFINDRLPLWVCKRRGGAWKQEYRLWPGVLPAIVGLPLSMGLFGACLQYQLHYMWLALASFLINLMTNGVASVLINYVAETFRDYATETTTILNFYRLSLGVVVPFFIDEWIASVGYGWVFGMMAFFSLGCSIIVNILIWKGPAIRRMSAAKFQSSEEGVIL